MKGTFWGKGNINLMRNPAIPANAPSSGSRNPSPLSHLRKDQNILSFLIAVGDRVCAPPDQEYPRLARPPCLPVIEAIITGLSLPLLSDEEILAGPDNEGATITIPGILAVTGAREPLTWRFFRGLAECAGGSPVVRKQDGHHSFEFPARAA